MKHGSLFSGIGGFDLAAQWMGWENIFHCEWNDFGKQVLKYYWPKALSYHDITQTDFTIHRGNIDILTGGFPCQPYSIAGKYLGKKDDRHLWPEMLRAIREIQPKWIVGENVLGLVNWNGGLVFEEVQADLEAEGYEVQSYVLPAVSVNAPHRRERIWFVAYCSNSGAESVQKKKISPHKIGDATNANSERSNRRASEGNREKEKKRIRNILFKQADGSCFQRTTSDTRSSGREQLHVSKKSNNKRHGTGSGNEDVTHSKDSNKQRERIFKEFKERPSGRCSSGENGFKNFPTQSPICNGDDGLSSRLDGITFPKWRNESIKAGGNAIVPQVAHQIFKAISKIE